MAQMGFFDLSDRYASLDAKKNPLAEVNDVVPWEEFRPLLEQVWRKPMDAVLMITTLVQFTARIQRLIMVMAIALYWAVSTGL